LKDGVPRRPFAAGAPEPIIKAKEGNNMRAMFRAMPLPAVVLLAVAAPGTVSAASSYQFHVLHEFCAQIECHDGKRPRSGLTIDGAGALYGTTAQGGFANQGTLFRLAQAGTGGKWRIGKLHSFCRYANCTDGSQPESGVILDEAGNLFGATYTGGKHPSGPGTLFTLTSQSGRYRQLHSFDGGDGGTPLPAALTYAGASAGLPYDGTSPLYGTASAGGSHNAGVVFEVKTKAGGGRVTRVIYDFGALPDAADGSYPAGDLVIDASGDLIGTTELGGNGQGVIFELSNQGGVWSETVLHTFCAEPNCADGGNHFGTVGGGASGLAMDGEGNLYGTTAGGGAIKQGCCGVLFKLVPNGTSSAYSVLYDFCAQNSCRDGLGPQGHLSIDASGNIFGTTIGGGGNNSDLDHIGGGTVYEFSGSTLATLYAFCAQTGCADGAYPLAGVAVDGAGNVFGTADCGGANAGSGDFCAGTAFELSPE
jgi:uncharacterized repeat protein (TIGR03803 family)